VASAVTTKRSRNLSSSLLFSSLTLLIIFVVLKSIFAIQIAGLGVTGIIFHYLMWGREPKYIIGSILLIISLFAFGEMAQVLTPSLIFISLTFYLLGKNKKTQIMEKLGFNHNDWLNTIFWVFIGLISIFITTIFLNVLLHSLGINDSELVANKILQFSPAIIPIAIFIGPVAEELFFRGYLQNKIGLIFSTLTFAVLHFSYGSISELIGVLGIGLVLGLSYKYSNNNIYVPMIAHILYNTLAITIIYSVI